MTDKRISPGLILYLFLLAVSIIVRFHNLGVPVLDETEAAIALNAINPDFGLTIGFQGDSGLSSILSPVLAVFGQSEPVARTIPALMGLILVFLPFLFQKQLGKENATVLSVLIMFDPGLIAYSRLVNGAILSVTGLLFAGGFFVNKQFIPSGIAMGIALLGSPVLWPGVLVLGLAAWLTYLENSSEFGSNEQSLGKNQWVEWFFVLAATVLIVGTAFFTRPAGLTTPLINLTTYFRGWGLSGGVPFLLFILSLFLYQPFALLLGLIEGLRSNRTQDLIGTFLLRWFFLSLLLAVVYPSRGMDSILISTIPLLVLFSRFITRVWDSLEKPDLAALGQMALVLLLIPFAWMNMIVLRFPMAGQDEMLRLAATLGSLVLLGLSTVLIHYGWPPKQAQTGIFHGFTILFMIFSLSTAWRAAGLGKYPHAEMWRYDGIADELDLLSNTAGDLSEWNRLNRQEIDITKVNYPSSSLTWALRDFVNLRDENYLPVSSNPSLVITAAEEIPALAETYRGQDFVVNKKTAWTLILPEEWVQWFAFRLLPDEKQQVILWARTDLFPGENPSANPNF